MIRYQRLSGANLKVGHKTTFCVSMRGPNKLGLKGGLHPLAPGRSDVGMKQLQSFFMYEEMMTAVRVFDS